LSFEQIITEIEVGQNKIKELENGCEALELKVKKQLQQATEIEEETNAEKQELKRKMVELSKASNALQEREVSHQIKNN